MNCINTAQVQLTNDASSVSKCSAVSKNYFKDDFIEEFVEKRKSRASLIHLGYYTRAVIIKKLINNFIEFVNHQKLLNVFQSMSFQIISCGSGFDTTYWRLSEANLIKKSLFIEIDYSDVIQRKILLINQSQKLKSFLNKSSLVQKSKKINKMNYNYYLLEADLSDLDLIERFFSEINVDYDIPTLFVSECVITYMKESDSSKLIKWMAEKFTNSAFLNYEQIHPDDGFGQVMLNHFNRLQSTLFSVSEYPDCDTHYFRYKNLGFQNSFSLSEWDALIWLTTTEERQRVLSLELFDEFEEFHLKCVHYVVAVSGNGILSNWITSFPPVENFTSYIVRDCLKADKITCEVEVFRHCSCNAVGSGFVFGGCSKQSRSSNIYKITYSDSLNLKVIMYSGPPHIQLDMVHGTAVSFELNKVPFVCLYGGRTSPNKIWNGGSPFVFELSNNELIPRLVIVEGSVIPRYRSPMVCLNSNENEAHCWMFGGRTADFKQPLFDFWELLIKQDCEKSITFTWKQHEKKTKKWPCSRMSHSILACPKRLKLFIIGGITAESASPLNDIWKWCCKTESWEEMQLIGKLLPRYCHTAHLKEDMIYLVGGVNTLAGLQPGLGVINLKNLTVTEYTISTLLPEPVLLFNHTSDLVAEGDDARICIFGGGGNCFSFGTYLNNLALSIKLTQLS